MPNVDFKKSGFDSFQAVILKLAYVQAIVALGGKASLQKDQRRKIGKIVAAVGKLRLAVGGTLAQAADV